jgi:hypothetical protein
MSNDPERQGATAQTGTGLQEQADGQLGGDPLNWFTGALILIWAGFVLLFKNMGEVLGVEPENASAWILTGVGVLLWLEAILRLAILKYRRWVGERVIMGMIFVIVGLGEVVEISLWPLLLVSIGIAMMLGYFTLPRRS